MIRQAFIALFCVFGTMEKASAGLPASPSLCPTCPTSYVDSSLRETLKEKSLKETPVQAASRKTRGMKNMGPQASGATNTDSTSNKPRPNANSGNRQNFHSLQPNNPTDTLDALGSFRVNDALAARWDLRQQIQGR